MANNKVKAQAIKVGKKSAAKKKKNVKHETGIVHIHSTTNNTIVTVTDLKGNTIG
jgi:small subunit ribosomal protein S11